MTDPGNRAAFKADEESYMGGYALSAEQKHTELITDLNPQAASLEGYLFPDTYRFPHGVTSLQILQAMVKRFRQVTTNLGIQNVAQTVTMASLHTH